MGEKEFPVSAPDSDSDKDGVQSAETCQSITDEPNEAQYSVFSPRRRQYFAYLLGFSMTLSTLTATIYFPLIPILSKGFGVSIQQINLTVTVYAIFQAISPGFFASLADTSGRRPVLLSLVALYACGSLGLALNTRNSYAVLISLRAVQSIGGSAITAISYGVVSDVAVVAERGRMLGPMMSFCNGLSAVGPVIGGAVAFSTGGYVWVFLALVIVAVACLLLVGFTLPETSRAIVGNGSRSTRGVWRTWWSYVSSRWHKSKQVDLSDTEEGLRPDGEATDPGADREKRPAWKPLSLFASLRIILYPDAAAVLWMVASSYCIYYTFQVAIPTIYDEVYGYNALYIGLAFLPGLAGMTIGGIIAGIFMDHNYAQVARKHGVRPDLKMSGNVINLGDFPIEAARYRRFIFFILPEMLLVGGYGWAVQYGVHVAVPLVLQFIICTLSTLMSHTASALLVDVFPDRSSSAYASGQIMRCGLSAALAAALQPLIDSVGRGWCFSILSLFTGLTGLVAVYITLSKGMSWRLRRSMLPSGR